MYEIGSARRVSGHRASRRVCRVSFVWSQSQAGTRNRRRLARVEQPARRDRTQVVQAKHGHCPPIPRRVVPVPRPASLPLACQVIDSGVVWPMRTESSPPGRGCLGCGIGGSSPCYKTDKFCSLHVGRTAVVRALRWCVLPLRTAKRLELRDRLVPVPDGVETGPEVYHGKLGEKPDG